MLVLALIAAPFGLGQTHLLRMHKEGRMHKDRYRYCQPADAARARQQQAHFQKSDLLAQPWGTVTAFAVVKMNDAIDEGGCRQ
jgi:hypothetical protein